MKPQWRSWLTRGAYLITGYGILLSIWVVAAQWRAVPNVTYAALVAIFAMGTAVYTAFLFGQCEARDLWQSPLVGVQLGLQMIIAGSAALLLTGLAFPPSGAEQSYLAGVLAWGLGGHLATALLGEAGSRHGSANAAAAARVLIRGRYAPVFWLSLLAGAILPLALLLHTGPGVAAAAVLALAGLWGYEHAFVMAGQSVPIS